MLTKLEIENAKVDFGKDQKKLTDGDGLYLLVTSGDGKYWRFNYRFGGKRKTLALGTYPDVSTAMARIRLSETRKLLINNCDPSNVRKEEKISKAAAVYTFRVVATEWESALKSDKADVTKKKIKEGLALLSNELGDYHINSLRTHHFVSALKVIEKRSSFMAAKARQYSTSVIRYAIQRGYRDEGLFIDLKGVLKALEKSSFPSPVKEDSRHKITDVIKAVLAYKKKNVLVGSALNLILLTFVRPNELVSMKWKDIQKNGTEWKYIISKTGKEEREHIVPLSTQVQKILSELKQITGNNEFVLSSSSKAGHIHRDSLSKALRDMGFKDVIVPHGSRHFASTMLNEMKFSADLIEMQLSHIDSSVRGIYNGAKWLPERHDMMQKWAEYIDLLAHVV